MVIFFKQLNMNIAKRLYAAQAQVAIPTNGKKRSSGRGPLM